MALRKGEKIWTVTKNGNFVENVTSKTKAVNSLHTLSGFDAPPVEQKDGSIMLDNVAHFRARETVVG